MKPDFFKDEHIAELPHWIRLLFSGLWCMADKQGKLEDSPKRIHAELFPYEPKIDIEEGLALLARMKHSKNRSFILRYIANDTRYIKILSWDEHQKPHHTERESEIPEPTIEDFKGMEKGMGKGKQEDTSPPLTNREITVKPKTPTLEEVRIYCQTNNIPIDAEAFFHHHNASGWVRKGGVKITNWHSSVATWLRNDKKFHPERHTEAPQDNNELKRIEDEMRKRGELK